jgi:hypothetical protein
LVNGKASAGVALRRSQTRIRQNIQKIAAPSAPHAAPDTPSWKSSQCLIAGGSLLGCSIASIGGGAEGTMFACLDEVQPERKRPKYAKVVFFFGCDRGGQLTVGPRIRRRGARLAPSS